MKFHDLLSLCLQNLKRQKSRTILTMLGVVVGVCSITVMVSLGIGLNEQSEKSLSSMGDLRVINVYSQGMDSPDSTAPNTLNDESVSSIESIPGVQAVTPKADVWNLQLNLSAGSNQRYKSMYTTICAMDLSKLSEFGFELTDGNFPQTVTTGKQNIPCVIGQYFEYTFADSMRPDGYNMIYYEMNYDGSETEVENEDPYFDAMDSRSLDGEMISEDGNTSLPVSFLPTGRLKANYGTGYETVEGMIMDLTSYKELSREYARLNHQNAKPITYSQAMVLADSIDSVADVEKAIQDLGFSTSSMESIRKSMQESSRFTQLILGGIGAISLLVAAIGIANTMVMSITERTREIGIMKALGCRISDIRKLFLLESGLIGLGGGLIGILVSLLISGVMNVLTSQVPVTDFSTLISALTGYGNRISVIPWWLIVFSIVFSTLVGLLSGLSPANKAVKISALEAIRHE